MPLVDSHCHLDFPDFDHRHVEILQNAVEHDVAHALCITTRWENRDTVLQLAHRHPGLSASIGVHPTTEGGHEPDADELVDAAADPLVVAVGETGLDYFRFEGELEADLDARRKGALAWQHQRFHNHIDCAARTGLPLIIHTRAAAEDTLLTLEAHADRQASGVMHCFAEDWPVAERALAIGFYISFSGIVTFKNAKAVQEVAKRVPLDRLLVETDSPYLAPVPKRGKTNEPAYVSHTAHFIAELRGIAYEELMQASTANFFELFSRADASRRLQGA
jgi:TatD DNase family protein